MVLRCEGEMSKAAQQARQIVIDELDQLEQETLELWRSHMDAIKLKGGAGSGNFGHSGRPGKVGGSGNSYTKTGADIGVLYHGGKKKITKVDTVLLQSRDVGYYGRGFYVTMSEDLAKSYGHRITRVELHPAAKVLDVGGITKDKAAAGLVDAVKDAYVRRVTMLRGKTFTERAENAFESQSDSPVEWPRFVNIFAQDANYDVVIFGRSEIVIRNPEVIITYKEVQSITIDPEIVTEEHESLLKDNAIELRTASMSSSQRETLQDKYNWLLSNEEDAARVKGIRDKGRVPPPILGGSEDDWWVVDGMHRIAILANDGVENFPAYFMTGIRNIKGGPGSGNFGHSGRPGKVGGSVQGSINAYVTIYHGTPSENIDGILRDGIKRGSVWFSRPPSVYVLTDKSEAELLAKNFIYYERYAIFEAKIPKSVFESGELDEHGNRDFRVNTAYRVESDINPDWLSSFDVYERYDVQGNLVRYGQRVDHVQHRVLKEFDGGFQTIYIIVAFDEGEVVEKQLPIDEASKQALLDLRIEMLKDELDALSEKVFSGDISIGQFQEDFKALIKGGRTSAAAIGKGGWDQMGPRDWGRLGTPLREEYKFLKGFVEMIEQNKATISLQYIKNRARMYADNIVAAAVQAEAGFFFEDNLPFLPRDGSTQCLSRCHCSWLLSVVESKKNFKVVEATWVLGEADHCETCISREGYKEVLKVPNDVDVPAKIGGY